MKKDLDRVKFNEELFGLLVKLEGYAFYEIEEFYFHLSGIVNEIDCSELRTAFRTFVLNTKLSDKDKTKMIHELHFILDILRMKGWSY